MQMKEIEARYADFPGPMPRMLLRACREAASWAEADCFISTAACQIVQTGWCYDHPATAEQRAWAQRIWADGAPNAADWTYPAPA